MFTVEIYTPGEIVAARHPLRSGNVHDAKIEIQAWLLMDGVVEGATFFRLVGPDGRVLIDRPIFGAFD